MLLIVSSSGCVVSIRTPVGEGPEVIELMIGETVTIGGHEVTCRDISIFDTSAILCIDGEIVMVKDLGMIDLPNSIDNIGMELVTITNDDGTHSIEIAYWNV